MAILRRQHEGGNTIMVGGIDFGAGRQQRLNNGGMPALSSKYQRGVAVLVGRVDLGAAFNEALHDGGVPVACSPAQGGVRGFIAGVDIGAGVHEQAKALLVAVEGGTHQRRPAAFVGGQRA